MGTRCNRVVGLEVVDEQRRQFAIDTATGPDLLPVVRRRHEMAVAERGRAVGLRVDRPRPAAIVGRPPRCSRRAPVAPPQRPARFGKLVRLVTGIVDALEHGKELGRRLAGDRRLGGVAAGPDITSGDRHRFSRQSDEPFDVVRLRILRVAEDDDIETLRVDVIVGELVDEDPVAIERRIARIVGLVVGGEEIHVVAAVRAAGRPDQFARQAHADLLELAVWGLERLHPAPGLFAFAGGGVLVGHNPPGPGQIPFELSQLFAEALRLVVLFRATADPIIAAAGGADEVLVPPHEGRRHGACGNDERLRLEGPKKKSEREGDDDRFNRLPAEGQGVDHHVAGAEPGRGRDDRGAAGRRGGGPALVDGHATGSGRKGCRPPQTIF